MMERVSVGGARGAGGAGGGRCCFVVESKSFEILINSSGGKLRGIIMERSKGFSNWIRFGDYGLRSLLGGVEACCKEEKFRKVIKTWVEERRKFILELRANEAGRYIICSVRDMEAKRFSLVFPEGRGLIGGWVLLAEKLCSLGIHLLAENKSGCRLGRSKGRKKRRRHGEGGGVYAFIC